MKKCNKYIVRTYFENVKQVDMVVKTLMSPDEYRDAMERMYDWELGMVIDIIPVK